MADEETQHRGDEPSRSDEPLPDAPKPIAISTSDPVIESAGQSFSDGPSDANTTVSVETIQMSEPNLFSSPGARPVGQGRRSQGHGSARDGKGERGDQLHGGHGRGKVEARAPSWAQQRDDHRRGSDDHQDRSQPPQQPSMMKNLLIIAGVAVFSGVLGAMGYSYFLGSRSEASSSDRSQPKREPGAEQAKSSQTKPGGGGDQRAGEESGADSSGAIPGFSSADDAETLKKQIMSLSQRFDQLSERVDRMIQPKDTTPPVLRTMQIKMGELSREMDDVAALPVKVRQYDNRLEIMQQDIKILRSRLDMLANGRGDGLTRKPAAPPQGDVPAPSAAIDPAQSPTMELGISLLERGQNASAREVFSRLQRAQPADARVWYLGALAAGLASGNWDGEARRFAEKGIERERAGTPSTAQIDAALAIQTSIKGADWVASLRRNIFGLDNRRK